MAKNAVITGWGFYAPSRVVTNFDMEKMVDTTDEWITTRTGIKERRFASEGETTSSMSLRAARAALERARMRPQDVQLVIVGTCSPDYIFPATACMVQNELGATRAGAFDIEAACTSFVTALGIARGMISSGTVQNALVIGAETLSRFLNFKDRTTCVLFGDGAGAVVVEASNASVGIESVVLHSDGSKGELLMVRAGGAKVPATQQTLEQGQHFITMEGGAVMKLAVKSMAAPGKPPDHRGRREATALPDGARVREPPAVREHLCRNDPDRHRRGRVAGAPPPWRQGTARGVRRRLHLGRVGARVVRAARRRASGLAARPRA